MGKGLGVGGLQWVSRGREHEWKRQCASAAGVESDQHPTYRLAYALISRGGAEERLWAGGFGVGGAAVGPKSLTQGEESENGKCLARAL